jgi:acyl-CoA synthetase (AMP-forming)/AMP-acid ligase II
MYGGTVVLPSDVFLAGASLQSLSGDGCTVIHAVSTMFHAMLDHPDAKKHAPKMVLRTGIVAGSTLPSTLMPRLSEEFGFKGLAFGYGMHFLFFSALTHPLGWGSRLTN